MTAPAPAPDGSFARRVYAVVRRVPPGTVTSYGAVAALAGSPRAARGVGAALNALLPGDQDVPWWRVVNRHGALSIPADLGLRALQRTLLESEGVVFLASGRVDLDRHAWSGPRDEEDEG
ncbi:MAG: MGMT family protein [Gemmatimonadota bacterium]